ncbi:MAG TPA: glycosyltransferase family 39 protein [Thermoanaerobaculia bacterium]|nr:glycosyltransferase family 39 protein [Thermoanaerobaculia bacterium]
MGTSAPLKIWLLISAAAIAIHLGGPPLIDADEGRNAEVAREMAATNDYVVPRLNTLPYLDKPIVYFAAEAAMMEILGPTELAARLPAYLFTLATAALVFWWTRKRIGADEALVGAIAFLAMPLTVAFARIVIFDSALAFFIVLSNLALYEAVETRDKRWTILAWAAIAAGVLTKGPVAIAVPLLVMIPYAIWRKAFRMLWSFIGLIVFVAIVTPWVWGVSREVPDFLEYVLITETAARLATDELQRTGPPWYFLPYLVGGALPWSIVAIAGWRDWKRRDPILIFLLLWILVPLVFFSISQSKRPQYILPVMPAVAMLIAWNWRTLRVRAAAIVAASFGVLLITAAFVPRLTAKMQPSLVGATKQTAIALGAALLFGGIIAAIVRRRDVALIGLSLPVIAIPLLANPLMHALGERRSARSFVAAIEAAAGPQAPVIGIEAFTGSMAFYLGRPVVVATDDASEFTSNYILRRYERYSGAPGSPVKPLPWIDQSLAECCERRIYVVRDDDPHHHQRLEAAGARKVVTGPHHIAYVHTGRN